MGADQREPRYTAQQIITVYKQTEQRCAQNAAATARVNADRIAEYMRGIHTARAAHNVREAYQLAQFAREDAKLAADRRQSLRTIAIIAARAATRAAETTLLLKVAQDYAECMRRREARNAARRAARRSAAAATAAAAAAQQRNSATRDAALKLLDAAAAFYRTT